MVKYEFLQADVLADVFFNISNFNSQFFSIQSSVVVVVVEGQLLLYEIYYICRAVLTRGGGWVQRFMVCCHSPYHLYQHPP